MKKQREKARFRCFAAQKGPKTGENRAKIARRRFRIQKSKRRGEKIRLWLQKIASKRRQKIAAKRRQKIAAKRRQKIAAKRVSFCAENGENGPKFAEIRRKCAKNRPKIAKNGPKFAKNGPKCVKKWQNFAISAAECQKNRRKGERKGKFFRHRRRKSSQVGLDFFFFFFFRFFWFFCWEKKKIAHHHCSFFCSILPVFFSFFARFCSFFHSFLLIFAHFLLVFARFCPFSPHFLYKNAVCSTPCAA
jgi:hypothetical protein